MKEIHRTELALLDALDWRIGVPTTLYWLGLYLDLLEFSIAEHCTDGHVMRIETVRKRAIAILDLVMHTPTQFSFPYSMVAAAAISLQLNDERLVTACTAFFPEQLRICVSWMLGLYYACPETIVFLSPKSPIDDGCRDSNNHEGRISFLNNSCNNDSSNLPTTTRLDASSAHLDDTDELVGSDENFEDDEFERAISTNSRVMAYLMEGMQSNQF